VSTEVVLSIRIVGKRMMPVASLVDAIEDTVAFHISEYGDDLVVDIQRGEKRDKIPTTGIGLTGAEIEGIRTSYGLTQRDLAELAGLGMSTICNVENDHRMPRLSTMRKIAAAFARLSAGEEDPS
jgi:DNA-binding XRE family transcriptional regulator